MASVGSDLDEVLVGDPELWHDGPPHELFRQLRGKCPVHWTARMPDFPKEAGYWSVTMAEDVHEVSRDLRRTTEHQAFGAGGRHFCLGTALARLELRVLLEETLARYPRIELAGTPEYVESAFVNQLKTLPVRLSPA
jgi:cytochrome P450